MKTVTSTEIQNKFGEYLDKARDDDIQITRNGRAIAVIISAREYQRLDKLDSAYTLEYAYWMQNDPSFPRDEAIARIAKRLETIRTV